MGKKKTVPPTLPSATIIPLTVDASFKEAEEEIVRVSRQIASLLQKKENKKGLTIGQIADLLTRPETIICPALMSGSKCHDYTIKSGSDADHHVYSHINHIPEPDRATLRRGGKYQGWELFSCCLRAS